MSVTDTIASRFSFDFEHSKILENLPMYFLIGVLVVAFIPNIPQTIKGPIVLVGIIGAVPFMFVIDAIAQIQAAQYIPLKARIKNWNKEVTFFCTRPVGQIPCVFDRATNLWTVSWDLGIKTNLPTMGDVKKIEIRSRTPWSLRNLGSEAYVLFRGVEVKHPQVVQVELWLDNPRIRTEKAEHIPQFRLQSGSEDWDLLRGKPSEDVIASVTRRGETFQCGHCNAPLNYTGDGEIIKCTYCHRVNRV